MARIAICEECGVADGHSYFYNGIDIAEIKESKHSCRMLCELCLLLEKEKLVEEEIIVCYSSW